MTESEMIAELTAVVRKADREFEQAGGTSRHWVRDHFLPSLQAAGFSLVRAPLTPKSLCTCDEATKSWRPEDRAALCGHLRGCPAAI